MTDIKTRQARVASAVSDIIGPLPVIVALCLGGLRDGRSVLASVGWSLVAILLLAVIPYVVTLRLRHPADGSRPGRGRKGGYMAVVAATSLAGLVVLTLTPTPRSVVDVAVTVVVTLMAVAIATALAGWSNHTAACAGGVSMCVVLAGPVWLALTLAVIVVGWARVTLNRHSIAQVVLGAVWGGAVSAVVLIVLL